MILFGFVNTIEMVAGWMLLVTVPLAVAVVAGLVLAAIACRDPATRHAILAVALIAACGSPFGVWFAHRAGWTLLTLPRAIFRPNPLVPTTSPTVGRAQHAVGQRIERSESSDVGKIPLGPDNSPTGVVQSERHGETASGRLLIKNPAGVSASQSADGDRFSALGPLAAILAKATWAVGLTVCLARMIHGWLVAQRLCREATPLERSRFADLIERVEKRFSLGRPLQIAVSERIGTAAALGGVQQRIVLPARYVTRLSPEELESVLIHETAHLVRRDHRLALVQRLAAAAYWPHPLIHVLNRQLGRAREECCDNYVLQHFDSRRYAQLLLRLAEWPAAAMPPEPTLAFLNRRWKLEARIAGLLDARRQSAVRPRRRLVLVAGTAIGAIVLASAMLRLTQASDKPAAADGNPPSIPAASQPTGQNPAYSAAGALLPPRMDLPGHASVQLGNLRFRTQASDLAFLPDGKTIVSASWRDGINYWDVATGRRRLHVAAKADKMRMTADRKRLVTQDTYDRERTSLHVWDAAEGKHVTDIKWPLPNPVDSETLQALTPDGTAAILSDREGQISIRDLASGRVLKQRALSPSEVEHVAVSPDGALLAIASDSNDLFLWEWQSANPPIALGPRRRYAGVAFSADGKRLAAGGDTKDEVWIFNLATHEIERSLTDPKEWPMLVGDLAFTPDGKWLAAANWIGRAHDFTAGILVWDVETGSLKHRFTVSGAQPRRVALSADGKLLAAPMGETLHVWSLETGQTVGGQTTGHTAEVCAVCFSPKGERIVTASDDGTARIWDAVKGRELHRLDHGGKFVRAAAVSPDGTLVATSGLDDKVALWQMETGKQIHALQGHGFVGGWRALQFSPDGSVLSSWGDDNNLRVWDVATGQLKRAFALKRSGTRDSDADRENTRRGDHLAWFEEQCQGGCFRNGGNQLVLAAQSVLDFRHGDWSRNRLAYGTVGFEIGRGPADAGADFGHYLFGIGRPAANEQRRVCSVQAFAVRRMDERACRFRKSGRTRSQHWLAILVDDSRRHPGGPHGPLARWPIRGRRNGWVSAGVDRLVRREDGNASPNDRRRPPAAKQPSRSLVFSGRQPPGGRPTRRHGADLGSRVAGLEIALED